MKKLAMVLMLGALFASMVFAQPFYAKGDMYCVPGCWGEDSGNELSEVLSGLFLVNISTDAGAGRHDFKIANADWSMSWPGTNQWCHTSGPGDLVSFRFNRNSQADGWMPDADFVWNSHYVPNPGSETWEVIGGDAETGSWTSGVMAAGGGSLHSVDIAFATPGLHEYKWRANSSWDDQVVGLDGGASAGGNIVVETLGAGDMVTFELDAETGRYHHTVTPSTSTENTSWGNMKTLFR